jgi:hypothetical protein
MSLSFLQVVIPALCGRYVFAPDASGFAHLGVALFTYRSPALAWRPLKGAEDHDMPAALLAIAQDRPHPQRLIPGWNFVLAFLLEPRNFFNPKDNQPGFSSSYVAVVRTARVNAFPELVCFVWR